MKILNLHHQQLTVEELLDLASKETVLIQADDGRKYILESADEFEQEVQTLGQSKKFMSFLHERTQESGSLSLEELEQKLVISDEE